MDSNFRKACGNADLVEPGLFPPRANYVEGGAARGDAHILGTPAVSDDIVIAGYPVTHLLDEGAPYLRAFLVDGVVVRIQYATDAVLYRGDVASVGNSLVYVSQFVFIIGEVLEKDTFRMTEKEEIHRFQKRLQTDFHIIEFRKYNPEVISYDKTAQFWRRIKNGPYYHVIDLTKPQFFYSFPNLVGNDF